MIVNFFIYKSKHPTQPQKFFYFLLSFSSDSFACCGRPDVTNSPPVFWHGSASDNNLVTMVTKKRLKAVPGDGRLVVTVLDTKLFRRPTSSLAVNLPANMNGIVLSIIILIVLPCGTYWVNINRIALHIFWLWCLEMKLAAINLCSSDLRPFLKTDQAEYSHLPSRFNRGEIERDWQHKLINLSCWLYKESFIVNLRSDHPLRMPVT